MEELFFIVIAVLGGISAILYYVADMLKISGTSSLIKNFGSLGNMTGKSKAEIISVVGRPQSISSMGNGQTLLQWQQTSSANAYHIAILFDENDIFAGISSETSV